MATNCRILVIDDNRDIHEDFRKILGNSGRVGSAGSALDSLTAEILGEENTPKPCDVFDLDFAAQGEEGLSLVQKAVAEGRPFAVTFVDVRMPPGWDGVETIENLWGEDDNLHAVIVTAYADYEWSEIIERLGHTDRLLILKKPFENIEIRQMASALCEKWQLAQERKVMTRALKESEARYVDIFNSMPSALISIDAGARVIHLNSSACELLGVEAEAAKGKLLTELTPRLAEEMPALIDSIMNGQVYTREKITCRFKGESRTVDVVAYPLRGIKEGDAVIRLDDVTERVRMEQMLSQSEKMMSVGGLAAGMAHEINNPLGGIMQGLQNIRRRFAPGLKANDEAADALGVDLERVSDYMTKRQIFNFMDEMAAAGRRAGDIVANMLQFSRKADATLVSEDINVLIERTLALAAIDYDLKKMYDFRQIQIERELDLDLPPVPCIASEIQQVLLNILRNAAQALQQCHGGDAPRITVRTRHEGDRVRIEIEDNGPGMDEKVSSHVFEPFFTTRPVGEGTGLGLSVSYFIIHDEHGGEIKLESTTGEGARFTISLPLVNKG